MTATVKINSQAVCIAMVLIVALCALYWYYPSKEEDITSARQRVEPNGSEDNKADGVVQFSRPETWEEKKKKLLADESLTIKEATTNVDGNNVFYREGVSSKFSQPGGVLLFLHGQAFSSETWKKLGTLHFMASNGYRPIAVDLPGFGKTTKFEQDAVTFMLKLKESLGLKDTPIVLISPSMSGQFSIPLLVSHPEAFKGYVPLAPVGTSGKEEDFKKVKVPTCIIYGDKDMSLGVSSLAVLRNIPECEIHPLKGAGHPAYLDAPVDFHDALLKFTQRVFA